MKCPPRLLMVLLLTAAVPALGQSLPPPQPPPPPVPLPDWDHLTAQQRDTLIAALRQRWNDIPEQRGRMLRHAERWQAMTPEQRRAASDGMRRYEDMSPEQRRQAKVLFEQMRALPPDQREALRQRWKAMTPQQREQWVQAHEQTDD